MTFEQLREYGRSFGVRLWHYSPGYIEARVRGTTGTWEKVDQLTESEVHAFLRGVRVGRKMK